MQTHLLRYAPNRLFNHRYRYHYLTLMAYQVLVNALKAPAHLQYQLAFLSTVSDFPQRRQDRKLTAFPTTGTLRNLPRLPPQPPTYQP